MPFGDEVAFCVLLADVAAGFAVVAGFAAGVELSVAAGALAAGGAVEGLVAEDCRAGAVPAKMRVAANTQIAMLGNFRMDLVSQRFGACANGGNCEVCSVMPRLPCERRGPSDRPLRECEGAQARSRRFGSRVWRARPCAKKSGKATIGKSFLVCCEGVSRRRMQT